MRKLRKCGNAQFNTGITKCPPNFGKKRMAIIVPKGTKLPANLTADALEELAHSANNTRIYGVFDFVEYAKNGGEVQTSANGYGPEEITGISALKETFTLRKYAPELHASFVRAGNREWGAYFIDEDNILYGENDGTDTLAPIDMSCIYTDVTPSPTSSAAATMSVTFAYADVKKAYSNYDYVPLGFNAQNLVLGLMNVRLEKVGETGNNYKMFEVVGGYDVTDIYGPLIATAGSTVVNGTTTAVTYDEATDTLTVAAGSGNTPISLKSPSVLYDNGIKGIEQVTA